MIVIEEKEMMAEGWEEEAEDGIEVDTDDSDLFHDIYVETATNFLHEVQMFDTFCMVRLASPNFYANIRKLTLLEFSKEFHEYGGDQEAVRQYLRNAGVDFIVE